LICSTTGTRYSTSIVHVPPAIVLSGAWRGAGRRAVAGVPCVAACRVCLLASPVFCVSCVRAIALCVWGRPVTLCDPVRGFSSLPSFCCSFPLLVRRGCLQRIGFSMLTAHADLGPRAWIVCYDGSAIVWQEELQEEAHLYAAKPGRMIRAQAREAILLPLPPMYIHYGGRPGDAAHEVVSASALEARLGFSLCATLISDPSIVRNLPLELFIPTKPSLPAYTARQWQEVKSAVRKGWTHPDVFVAPDSYGGHGLFAADAMSVGTLLGEYTGELVRDEHDQLDDYAFNFPSLSGNLRVSARNHGSLIRFLNHETAESATCTMQSVMVDGCIHLLCFTRRQISPNDELTYDYGQAFWKARKITPGAPLHKD